MDAERLRPLGRLQVVAVIVAAVWNVAGSSSAFAQAAGKPVASAAAISTSYVGSDACRPCHGEIYERWKRSRMANVVLDPKAHPDAIIPDLTKSNPLVTFTATDIAFVYGSRWKQRYFKRVGDDYFPLPAQWDITHGVWKPYSVASGTDWWVPFYPAENAKRPTGPLCDGCHSVAYDVRTKRVSEWNVGCEKCHGPGADHAKHPTRTNIIDPENLDRVAANDVCIQCHSQGRPMSTAIAGRVYDWPVGYRVGLALKDFWRLEDHRLGETTFTHFADGSAHKNRMQGNDFVQSVMYSHGITCANCHDAHGSGQQGSLTVPAAELCQQCHSPGGKNGPRAATLEGHTHHAPGSAGSSCIACHMPKIAQTIGDVMVHSHTFRFLSPSLSENSNVPNPCTTCHEDKSNAWASAALRAWTGMSPWRVAP